MATSFSDIGVTKNINGLPLAGTRPFTSFGTSTSPMGPDQLQFEFDELNRRAEMFKNLDPEVQKLVGPSFFSQGSADSQLVNRLMDMYQKDMSPEEQERKAEMFDKYQTRKGWKSLMFNTLGSGLENLTKGIAMSMNPYGTPEAARYAADMVAGSGDRLAAAYAAARTPMAIPAVQVGAGPTYF